MDPYSSSSRENFNIKTRKPYTITKQRERWTEDEHNSFLEALKLYGRAWQRIEEHIGTKTAVQIRSHAQKFFTKLEKEAVARGVPISQALDMEIPPPRPKRKPNYPYPRKISPQNHHPEKDGIQATLVSSVQSGIQILDLEKKPLPENQTTSNEQKPEENAKLDDGPCELLPSDNERQAEAVNPGAFREFIPAMEEAITHDEANESYITIETREHHQKLNQDGTKHINTTSSNTSSLFENSHLAHETIIHCQYSDKLKQPVSINDIQGVQNYPRHVPVQVVDGNQGINAKNSAIPDTSFQESTLNKSGGEVENPNSSFVNIAAASGHHNSATRSSGYHQTVPPTLHPLSSPLCDNNHRSFLHVSSTISSLIVSSLLQNPAAHAAASFAATYWHPTTTTEASSSVDSPPESNPPSMAAIAAATVAAATAWWAAHGLLPVCTPPFYPGYSSTSSPLFSYGTPPIGSGNQARVANNNNGGEKEGIVQEEKMMNEGFPKEHPHPVDLSESSEDSDGQGDDDKKSNAEPIAEEMAPATTTELHDSDKTNNVRKQVDRSSCGSNTTSSSEIETDALPKHGGKEREEAAKGSDVNLDSISRTRSSSRSTISPNESWKEVSEEGRLAFQALFSRQVLPQSFCKVATTEENGNQNGGVSHLDLNREAGGEKDMVDEGLLRMGLGSVKLNIHHTGFKPYKRCSIEAKEGKIASQQNDEKGPKRMRLEADQLQLD